MKVKGRQLGFPNHPCAHGDWPPQGLVPGQVLRQGARAWDSAFLSSSLDPPTTREGPEGKQGPVAAEGVSARPQGMSPAWSQVHGDG